MLKKTDSTILLLLVVTFGYIAVSLGDYHSGYFQHVLRTKTASACEGDKLKIKCPFQTTIAVQGAMYGRKVPSSEMCPVTSHRTRDVSVPIEEDVGCETRTAYPKTVRECNDKRICQLLVHPRVFGLDPCPATSKYLTVSYKCRFIVDELRKIESCAGNVTKLRCPRKRLFIAVYDVLIENKEGCSLKNDDQCNLKSNEMFDYVTNRCHKRARCVIPSSICGGHLRVKHACVPRNILTRRSPSVNLSVTALPPTTDDVTTNVPTTTSLATTLPILSRDMPTVKTKFSTSTFSVHTSPAVEFFNVSHFTSPEFPSPSSGGASYKSWDFKQPLTSASSKEANIPTYHLSASIQATNEFPMLETFDLGSDPPSEPSIVNAMNSTMISGNVTFQSDLSFDILRSFIHLIAYIQSHLDRALAVMFGSLAAALFLALLVVFYFVACPKKKLAAGTEVTQKDERTNLITNRNNDIISGPQTVEGNVNNQNAENCTDEANLPLRGGKRKKQSAQTRMLRKFCSCCCSNAPWQRNEKLEIEHPGQRSPSPTADNDDIISVPGGEEDSSPFQGPLPYSARRDSVDSPQEGAAEPAQQNDDNTSEYEFVDLAPTPEDSRPERPTTLQTTFNNSPIASRTNYRVLNDNIPTTSSKPYTMQQVLRGQPKYYPPRQMVREPPPFPRQGGFNPHYQTAHHQTVPHLRSYQTHSGVNAPHSVSPIPVQQVSIRSNRQNHYVSLQPSAFETAQLNGGRRDSFYDNSLPRDSPLYEYYQRQAQQRQELPGTRNINQYFS